MPKPSLRTSYGVVILPKGLRLYHTSSNELCLLPEKPVIFMTLHPSEYYVNNSYVSVIELQRDVELLFMITAVHRNMSLYSALNNFIGKDRSNLLKMNYDNVKKWIPNLQEEQLDGWFSSVENRSAVEFAVINDPSNLKIVECKQLQHNWRNTWYDSETNSLVPKNWGTLYPIYSQKFPIKMILNIRFKSQIEEYVQRVTKENLRGTAFELLLENSDISYVNAPVGKFKWAV